MACLQRIAALLLLSVLVACQPAANSGEVNSAPTTWAAVQDIKIDHAWARATPPSAKVAAAYARIRNTSEHPARLIGAESEFTSSMEIHSMTMQDGMMRMRRLESVEIPAGESVALQPGGNHFMLFGLSRPLLLDQRVMVYLQFEGGQVKPVELLVRQQAPGS